MSGFVPISLKRMILRMWRSRRGAATMVLIYWQRKMILHMQYSVSAILPILEMQPYSKLIAEKDSTIRI